MRRWLKGIVVMVAALWLPGIWADSALLRQKAVQSFVHEMVQHDHFDRKQVQAILAAAIYQPQIIESMERPYEKKNWDVYQSLFLTPERLNSGLTFWHQNRQVLAKVEKEYGVPAEMIVAIIGVETLYGKRQGTYRVLDALTTLAFYYPARGEYFKKELREYLLLCREHGVSATQYLGSYAGAMGKPQFMPSSYRIYAVDFSGRGRPNLMSEDRDVIFSVANYFKQHGWQAKQMVVEKAQVSPKALPKLALNSKSPNYDYRQLVAAGVQPQSKLSFHPKEAGLLELVTAGGPEYWLAYPNFYVITRYNTSPQYALVVYLLAQSLREHYSSNIT